MRRTIRTNPKSDGLKYCDDHMPAIPCRKKNATETESIYDAFAVMNSKGALTLTLPASIDISDVEFIIVRKQYDGRGDLFLPAEMFSSF